MCIFCNNAEIKTEELKKCYIKKCNICNSKIVLLKNNGKVIVSRFPKKDKIRYVFLFSPIFLIGLFLFLILMSRIDKNIESGYIIKLFLSFLIFFVAFIVFCSTINILNYRKRGYLYYGLNNVITNDGKRRILIFAKFYNYFLLFFGIQFIIIMSIMVYRKII
jgi:hypothetical protein